jgi:hypothetical protein
MKKLIPLLFMVGCVTLAPPEQRQVRNVIDSKGVKAGDAYKRALIWFAKSVNNANWSVQIKDENEKRIVANLRLNCADIQVSTNILGNLNFISFVADFQAKDDRFRLTFEDVHFFVRQQNGNEVTHGPSSAEDLNEIDAKCLKSVRDSFTASVSGGKNTVDSNF